MDVVIGPRAVAGGDGLRQPGEHDSVVGGHDPGGDGAINPGAALDVVVPDRSADDARDDVSDLGCRTQVVAVLGGHSTRAHGPAMARLGEVRGARAQVLLSALEPRTPLTDPPGSP